MQMRYFRGKKLSQLALMSLKQSACCFSSPLKENESRSVSRIKRRLTKNLNEREEDTV